MKVMKENEVFRDGIHRRFSDFDFLFEVDMSMNQELFKKFPGVIFPAFPDKGILGYVKTKVVHHLTLGCNCQGRRVPQEQDSDCGAIHGMGTERFPLP